MPDYPIIVYTGSAGQDLVDVIRKADNRPLNESEVDTIAFSMREADSETLKVADATASISGAGNALYSFDVTNLDTPGEYFGWWHLELLNGDILDSPEFLIIVAEHAPGIRIRTGAIYLRARSEMPYTWDALEKHPSYGDKFLQDKIEVVKLRILQQEILTENEVDLDIRVQDFLGKVSAIQVIPAGIDYWMNQHETVTTGGGGTTEITSYPNRIDALKETYTRLIVQIRDLEDEVVDIIGGGPILSKGYIPEFADSIDEGFVTPSPTRNFRDYAFRDNRRRSPYSNWLPWDGM
jgi:hypothetical protein